MITHCNFKREDENKYVCEYCGTTVPIPNVLAFCDSSELHKQEIIAEEQPPIQPQQEPSLLKKIVNFTVAATKHAAAGNPVVSEEQLQQRLALCKSCPLFKPNDNTAGGVCTHGTCGCNIKDEVTYLNKIAWADQECPIGKWGKVQPNGV